MYLDSEKIALIRLHVVCDLRLVFFFFHFKKAGFFMMQLIYDAYNMSYLSKLQHYMTVTIVKSKQ